MGESGRCTPAAEHATFQGQPSPTTQKEAVRRGYDALSHRYDAAFDPQRYHPWIAELCARLPARSRVLDVGCGSGVPLARELTAAGHHVTGVDISEVQVRRARELVPGGDFIHADAAEVSFPSASFDAVVTLYTLIHIPLEQQPPLLRNIAVWLRPGGLLLAVTGHRACLGRDENWLGGGAAMWWSHADAATNRSWIGQAGLTVEREEFIPEGAGGHALFWARR